MADRQILKQRRLSRRACRDVAFDHALEHVQRHASAGKSGFAQILYVVCCTQRSLRALAALGPHRVADLVAARLSRRGAIALDLASRETRCVAALFDEIPDRLLAAPFHVMDSGIDHAAIGAEELEFEIA